ncbi:MAG TPA: Gfo/Idh/MocA family oxidoreductase [Candidatus Latescibacteria bacterium]|jgi:predicted dehydrogenase|nr:hypothetical protein [Gemmatimonadota bacterium]MDP7363462.1 Gfo/Idh/MocA family oxidoreductase [Candidatus Latescibacterota bacterium]MDP7632910.1 Gfo/Idh/MocA family oxidoreductase [Candidatus Latescibacterota bacterium]HCV23320.1 hypothetical protein [Candidatus Latescibacterota bacterium]HJN27789.1 Gfo/Idh/MocA family oxidoreductase [Candidatus Latescibacterota bacterium]|tara:strand:+ start:408 stop:1484 length:1077 start_codon:yes stop_codon:yes gene_type:complete
MTTNNVPTYRAVLIGLGGIGGMRAATAAGGAETYGPMPQSHAEAYQRHPQANLTAVCDLRPEALEQFRENWKDVWPDLRTYTDAKQMLAEESPDLVSVVTSDHAHANLVVDAAQTESVRAILCEKPIATTLADADRMIEATAEAGVLLSIEHTRRWDAQHSEAKRLLVSGELGPVRTIHAELYSQRAMLFRNGTHQIDLINYFADGDPAWVVAELEEGFDHYTEYQGDGGKDPDSEPYASAYIRYDNGVRAFYNTYKTDFPGSQIVVTCEAGRLEMSDRHGRVIRGASHFEWSSTDLVAGSLMYERIVGALHELIHTLEHGGTLVSDGAEGRKTLEVILAIMASHEAGNNRVDLPLAP